MTTPDLEGYLRGVVAEHLDGDASRFEELWERVPGPGQAIRGLTGEIGDVHWRSGTVDGWYCVQAGPEYAVYYQERGIVSGRRTFASEAAATTFFLRTLGYLPAVSATHPFS